MKLRLELIVLGLLFVGLALFAAFNVEQKSGQRFFDARATSFSSDDNGTLALYRWLNRVYEEVERLAYRPFTLNARDGMLFVLGPSERYEPDQVAQVTTWVAAGGVLVVADNVPDPRSNVSPLLAAFDLKLERMGRFVTTAEVLHPALGAPPIEQVSVQTGVAVASLAPLPAFAPLAVADAQPIIVGQRYGDGYVIAVASLYPFTNEGLREPESAALILNLLRRLPAGKQIVFDEFHHGFGSTADLRALLLSHPAGWAIIYSVVVVGLFILAGSRRFARPLPLRSEAARRSSIEYIDSVAGMLRRAGHLSYAAEHYRQTLRRRLGQPYGLATTLDDQAFVSALAAVRPVDQEALLRMLTELRRTDLREAELLRLIGEADRLA
ncbi:DUF4350 domain-containing protein [Chloroflexus sp.]|uniref:DUF4350 domain-containing protein n=1 Tax=Chloroflexus sp. TaxID=1904827 RepID=UPI00260CD645|nr:DUF4350 domain-containing protein [uncultured Chloroflexus sp.]